MQHNEQERSSVEQEPPLPDEESADERFPASTIPSAPFPGFPAISLAEEGSLLSLLNSWLDVLPDALVLLNQAGQMALVNHQLETLFGYPRKELVGLPLEILLPERFHAAHVRHRQHFAANPRTRPMGVGLELFGRRQDGSEMPVDISLSPLRFEGASYVLATIRDTTEHRRLQEREQAARQQAEGRLELLQLILDELPTSVCLVQGEEARLVLANRAAATIWGATWQVGQSLPDFLATNHIRVFDANGDELLPAAFATMRALHHQELVRQEQEVIRHPDGTLLPVLINAVALGPRLLRGARALRREAEHRSGSEEPVALVVHQDVTERLELERRKDEFIGMAGHELKTPLTSIKLAVQWLSRQVQQQGDASSAQMLTKIDTQIGTLTRLINELLDVTKMTTGTLSWHEEWFDFDALVREVVEDLQRTTDIHQIRREGGEQFKISADRDRMGQVLTNILLNAIKYSPLGGPIVVKQSIAGDQVTLSVQDCGIGIPTEKQAHLFERFYRVDHPEHGTFPGLGLGLYLAAETVKRQGGQIWVNSQVGVGSTFSLTLPVQPPSERMKGAER